MESNGNAGRGKAYDMDTIARVFIHGLDSSSRGTKGSFFRERYPGMFMEDYSGPLERGWPNSKKTSPAREI